MQVACQMVHWIQQALIERSMDGEARVNKNEGGSADHVKGHDEISHDQETVSSEVHEERGGDEEVHEVSVTPVTHQPCTSASDLMQVRPRHTWMSMEAGH